VLVQIDGVTTPEDAEMVNGIRPDQVGAVPDAVLGAWNGIETSAVRTVVSNLSDWTGTDNVVDAIRAVRPYGVDSETQTSRYDDRRLKDPEKVRLFVERARSGR
jgi:phosphoribosylanthranilate isomerase